MIEWKSGPAISVLHAEEMVAHLAAARGEQIRLDLSACQHIDSGVGPLLACAMRPFNAQGQLSVVVPAFDSSLWFKLFTRSLLGPAISRYASSVSARDADLDQQFDEHYSVEKLLAQNVGIWCGLHRSTFAAVRQPPFDVETIDRFAPTFEKALSLTRIAVTELGNRGKRALREVCFEAIQNVADHAARWPLPLKEPTHSYFGISYYRNTSTPRRDVPGNRREYLDRLSSTFGKPAADLPFIEITVADDGAGMAARHSQDAAVVSGPFKAELDVTRQAFAPGGTVKLRSKDAPIRGDPGFGTHKIMEGVKDLRAYVSVRTGRTLAYWDATSAVDGLAFWDKELAPLPGTVVQLLVPFPQSQTELGV